MGPWVLWASRPHGLSDAPVSGLRGLGRALEWQHHIPAKHRELGSWHTGEKCWGEGRWAQASKWLRKRCCLQRAASSGVACFLQPTDHFVPRAPCQDFPGLAGNIPGTPKASLPLSLGQLMVSSNVFPGWALWAQLISVLRGWGEQTTRGT